MRSVHGLKYIGDLSTSVSVKNDVKKNNDADSVCFFSCIHNQLKTRVNETKIKKKRILQLQKIQIDKGGLERLEKRRWKELLYRYIYKPLAHT